MEKTLRVINGLKKKGLIKDYAIGGGVGTLFYTEPVLTYDLDVFVLLPSKLKKKHLISLSPIYDELKKKYPWKGEHLIIEGMPVQFIPSDGLEREAIEKAKTISYQGIKTKVIRPEYLIALFLKAGRRKDKEKINLLLEQTKVNKKRLKRILKKYNLKLKLK